MTRHIVLGNGTLLVNIDKWLQVRDFYYPHVGEENHLLGHAHRTGVFIDGKISWINEKEWEKKVAYKENTLISDCSGLNKNLSVELKINECVECDKNIFLKRIAVKNLSNSDKEIKVFFHHDFHLYGNGIGDTAGYEPSRNIVFHYNRKRHFLINAIIENSKTKGDISDYSVGNADMRTINDASDGILEKIPIAQGFVDSIISVKLSIRANSEESFYYWICCGQNFEEVHKLNSFVLDKTPKILFSETEMCWLGLANKSKIDFTVLDKEIANNFKRSVLVIRTQIDNHGAIVAGTDSDNLQFNKDTYSYVWTRDGALIAIALQKSGYPELSENFYLFCKKIISDYGCFLHKYNPDGSLGSSWHPWVKDGKPQLPIQEDETALIVYALWDYYYRTKNLEFVKNLYAPLIKKAADFMVSYIDKNTNLPRNSYDLWEERHGIFTFTCSTVYAALKCASQFAELFNEGEKAGLYRKTSENIKEAMLKYLFDKKTGRFLRMIKFMDGEIVKDFTVDSSLYSLFEFGVLSADDSMVEETMKAVKEKLWLKTDVEGLARYEDDLYHKIYKDELTPGNPWFICTAWLGKYYVAKAKNQDELKSALEIIDWLIKNSLTTGIMPEQINPFTGEPLSVSPLTWSHSEFIDLVANYVEKYKMLIRNFVKLDV